MDQGIRQITQSAIRFTGMREYHIGCRMVTRLEQAEVFHTIEVSLITSTYELALNPCLSRGCPMQLSLRPVLYQTGRSADVDDQAQYTFRERVVVSLWNMRTILQRLHVRLERLEFLGFFQLRADVTGWLEFVGDFDGSLRAGAITFTLQLRQQDVNVIIVWRLFFALRLLLPVLHPHALNFVIT